jgi:hypothetical protein
MHCDGPGATDSFRRSRRARWRPATRCAPDSDTRHMTHGCAPNLGWTETRPTSG